MVHERLAIILLAFEMTSEGNDVVPQENCEMQALISNDALTRGFSAAHARSIERLRAPTRTNPWSRRSGR